jgi:hypothetical protein
LPRRRSSQRVDSFKGNLHAARAMRESPRRLRKSHEFFRSRVIRAIAREATEMCTLPMSTANLFEAADAICARPRLESDGRCVVLKYHRRAQPRWRTRASRNLVTVVPIAEDVVDNWRAR